MKWLWLAAGGILTVSQGLAAQRSAPPPPEDGYEEIARLLAWGRSGRVVLAHYQGIISWTWNTGTAIEAVEAGLLNGEVHCDVTYTTPEGSHSKSGPGLMDISLGLKPDEEAPKAQRVGQWYSFRVACPSAAPNAQPGDPWSHSQDSYKQPGGEVLYDKQRIGVILPKELKGGWTVSTDDGSEHTSMTWRLCRIGDVAVAVNPGARHEKNTCLPLPPKTP